MGFLSSLGDSLMEGYAFGKQMEKDKRDEEVYNLWKPYLKEAQDAQKTTIQANPNFRLIDLIPKSTSPQEKFVAASMPDINFAPEYNKPTDTTSPITLKQAMPMNEWMSKYGWLAAKQIGADALPWAIRTGDENRLVSLIKGGIDPSRQQSSISQNNAAVPSSNYVSPATRQNELGKRYGFPSFDFRSASYKPPVAEPVPNNSVSEPPGIINGDQPNNPGYGDFNMDGSLVAAGNRYPAGLGTPQMRDFTGRLKTLADTRRPEVTKQWIVQNKDNLLAKGIDPNRALALVT